MSTSGAPATHPNEPHGEGLAQRLNWLRAGVLGANDGIVSEAAIVVGVAGATTDNGPLITAAIAALIGGAISMALGEYVSVSSQSDSEKALIEKEREEIETMPTEEFDELVQIYESKGLTHQTAEQVAKELTEHDVLTAHLDAELNINQDDVVNPWHAALASALSFTLGALLPVACIFLPIGSWRIPVTFAVVLIALAITGATGAHLGNAPWRPAMIRVVIGGALALIATYGIGSLLGTSGVV